MLKKILKSDNGKGNIRFVNFSEMVIFFYRYVKNFF